MVKFYIENTKLAEFVARVTPTVGGITGDMYLEKIEAPGNPYQEQIMMELKVIRSSSFDVTPDYKIAVTDLNKGSDGFLYKRFYNKGFGGVQFKISIVLEKDAKWHSLYYKYYMGGTAEDSNDFDFITVLKAIMRTMTPVKVVTDAIDIPNGTYIITKNPSRKQTNDNYTIWELEFTTYVPLEVTKYKNDNTLVKKAIKSATAKKVATKTTTAAKKTTTNSSFSKCQLKVLVYSKKKKTYDCVKQMQKILKNAGYYTGKLDGWYGSLTVSAVKKFQKKYKKTYNLKVNGKVDKKTFNALLTFKTGKKQTTSKVSKTLANALKKA